LFKRFKMAYNCQRLVMLCQKMRKKSERIKKNEKLRCLLSKKRIKNERLKRVKIKMLNQQRRKRDPS